MFSFHNKNKSTNDNVVNNNDNTNNLDENNKEEISYHDAFNYILNHQKILVFAIDFNDNRNLYYPFGSNYFFRTDYLLDLLSKGDIDFYTYKGKEAYLSIDLYLYKFKYSMTKIDEELSSNIELSNDSKVIFEKIKAIINLINNIKDKMNSDDFIKYYYFYCDDKDEAIKNITSVVKIFDELRKLIFKLNDNCKKDIFEENGLGHEQLDKCLNEIINK